MSKSESEGVIGLAVVAAVRCPLRKLKLASIIHRWLGLRLRLLR